MIKCCVDLGNPVFDFFVCEFVVLPRIGEKIVLTKKLWTITDIQHTPSSYSDGTEEKQNIYSNKDLDWLVVLTAKLAE